MRKTKVDHKTGLIGAHRKIKQTQNSPVCPTLTEGEANAVLNLLRDRKRDLQLRRKLWEREVVVLANELGGTLVEERTLPEDLRVLFTSFVGMVKRAAAGEKYLPYTAEEAKSYWDYLSWMDRQIEDLFDMTRDVGKE